MTTYPTATPASASAPPEHAAAVRPLPVAEAADVADAVVNEVCRAVIGKRDVVRLIVAALLADGHVLLDDLPGVAKTLTARSIATAAGLRFARVQFTPDVLPSDITGSLVLDLGTQRPEFRPGPIFTELLLADEVNRSPAKTQAALLEAMQERQVTTDGVARPLPHPHLDGVSRGRRRGGRCWCSVSSAAPTTSRSSPSALHRRSWPPSERSSRCTSIDACSSTASRWSAPWALPPGTGPVALGFRIRARTWGRQELGSPWVQARRPGGLLIWEGKVATGPDLRVLPAPMRLNRVLRPLEPRTVAGVHLSRQRGSGTDFAELRPYIPGDRLRDLSWSASARAGEPWVIVHHPERTGTVLLLLDAFFDHDRASTAAFSRAAQAAWAVAAAHLRVQDQVGLMAVGRTTAWLPPQGGRRARWLLLDELLAVGRDAEHVHYRRRHSRAVVPADALVVGVTTLRSRGFISELVHHRRAGHTTVALVIDMTDLIPPPRDQVGLAAYRLWRTQRDLERDHLQRSGVPTALVTADGVTPAISVLRQATSRQQGTTERAGAR